MLTLHPKTNSPFLLSISKTKFVIKSCESITPEVSEYKAEKQLRFGSMVFSFLLFMYSNEIPFLLAFFLSLTIFFLLMGC